MSKESLIGLKEIREVSFNTPPLLAQEQPWLASGVEEVLDSAQQSRSHLRSSLPLMNSPRMIRGVLMDQMTVVAAMVSVIG